MNFSTGKRAKVIFTVFSSLIPKFASLLDQAIPLSILSLIGFIPTNKAYVHVQPNIAIYYIKIVFAVIPIILSIVSFVFKNKYPIKEKYNILIKKGIEVQKMNFNTIKKKKINYFKLTDPVFNVEHININTNEIINNSLMTKDLCNHFNRKDDLMMIYQGKLELLKNKLMKKIIMGLFLKFYFFRFNFI